MEKNCIVPHPIKLNCWKHHARFIINEIESIKSESQLNQSSSVLLKVGESQMDLYIGDLLPAEIANQTINFLTSNLIKTESEFLNWLKKDRDDYQSITLKDKSVWTLRQGDEDKRFVHIHPGRYSSHTVRVKALTLKTAIVVMAYAKVQSSSELDIDLINETRKRFLDLPPLKSVKMKKGLGKLLSLLNSLNV